MLGAASFMGFIAVRDAATARSFYQGVLGLAVTEDTPFAVVVDANGTALRLTPVPDLTVQPFTVAGWAVPDIGAAVQALTARGVSFRVYDDLDQDALGIWTAPSGDRVAWFSDPDGNTLSLTTFAG